MNGICECNVYICKKCGMTDGTYHGSWNCVGKEIYLLECEYCEIWEVEEE